MEILLITPYYPYPGEKTGGTHVINMIIKNFSNCIIDIFYYGEIEENTYKFSHNIRNIHYENLIAGASGRRVLSLLLGKTYTTYMFKPKSKVLDELFQTKHYDCIIYDQFASMHFIEKYQGTRNILFMYDSMPMLFHRKYELAKSFKQKVYYYLQERYAIHEEKCSMGRFDKVVFVSSVDIDYERTKHIGKDYKYTVCNLGIELDSVEAAPVISLSQESIIFTGIMDYEPNEDAMIYFVENIYPRIIERKPDITLYIVGKNPTKKLLDKTKNNTSIVITGRVENIFTYIKSANIYISPLRLGSGKKNKIIEAMACGRPIIASKVSLEGFDDLVGRNIVCRADSDEEWVDSILHLLNDNQTCLEMTANMKNTINEEYDWKIIADGLLSII